MAHAHRAQTTPAPTTQAPPPTQAPASARPRATAPPTSNPAAQLDGALDGYVPDPLKLDSVQGSFGIKEGKTLDEGDWSYDVNVSGGTRVWITVTRNQVQVSIHPGLLIDAIFPMSNVVVTGLTWDLTKGALGRVRADNDQWLIPTAGMAQREVGKLATTLFSGTRFAKAGYDPLSDPQLAQAMAALQVNAGKLGGGGGDVGAKDLSELSLSASFTVQQAIQHGTPAGGISLPAGAQISVSAEAEGTAADLGKGGIPALRSLGLTSSGLTLLKDGAPIAKLQSLSVLRGGKVDVHRFEALGSLKEAGGVESGIKALAALFALHGGAIREADALSRNLDADIVNGVAEKQIEAALTAAVLELVNAHHDAIPGMDLRSVLGVQAPKA
jgi:hypothetical protein